jgi:hypothetical protein
VEINFHKDIKYNKRFIVFHHAFHHAKPTLAASLEICSEFLPKEGTKF